ncbi:hypothetical protein ACIGQE_21800 [Streptomyces sp. NPDC053429]|uniref:hypothetical protein n=1 Tax=Streptomyces sp. NPDC053429 TaxID=3365702 RepID=UPI0037D3404F
MKAIEQVLTTVVLVGAAVVAVPAAAHAAEPVPSPVTSAFGIFAGFSGFGFPGSPGDVYAQQLPANTLGFGGWANKNEVRPGQEGIFAKILKGAL